ncbi:methyltransferase domain-containing protein [Erythrobacter arachoides]|uniref:Methyltransferase domain-containing protein n=1 Tax=Aurantiacibacter arachoides TaxID=1850444 RepID=A0A844ZYT7_9SPHN|nr:class I SAM-dependent methyltransferase [Aurantiacibacter arachoides]MXO93055.1 methyltransferase domain-containing protein [Aurantiacibacter arachoides]GGD52373.1 methyltransferase type 11 [Aurantiacibacter arachoides]
MARRLSIRVLACIALCAGVAACDAADDSRLPTARDFPRPYRPVSELAGNSFSTEEQRDNRREAETVMDQASITEGMTVADIGAGEGYYTVRLADRVGDDGRVLAQDIDPAVLRRLGSRVERERHDNVSIITGDIDHPRLPPNSFDRIFMVHMYHEVTEPYAFLWNMRPALREGGQVIVVDVDRPADQHGIDPQLLFCEFERVGYRLVEFVRKPQIAGYYAQFEVAGERPEPRDIEPCMQPGNDDTALTLADPATGSAQPTGAAREDDGIQGT